MLDLHINEDMNARISYDNPCIRALALPLLAPAEIVKPFDGKRTGAILNHVRH